MQKMRRQRNQKAPKRSSKISDDFSKRDFVCHCGNCKDSVRISLGLVGGLELLRTMAKNRVNVVKGYVCPEEAEKSGRVQRNFHCLGVAADVTVDMKDIREVFLMAEQVPEFKGIGLDLTKKSVHVDTRKADQRVLWVVDSGVQVDLTDANRERYLGHVEAVTD